MRSGLHIAWLGILAVAAIGACAGEAIGIIEPAATVDVSALTPGIVSKVLVEEGDVVQTGDLLAQLDDALEKAEMARRKLVFDSKVELEAARLQLQAVEHDREPERRKLVWEDKSAVEAAAERVKALKRDLDATRQVFERTKSVSQEELDEKELAHRLVQAEQQQAQLAEAREKIEYEMAATQKEDEQLQAEARIAQLEIVEKRERLEYEMALAQFERKQVRSPVAGVVSKVLLDVGEYCDPREPVLTVVDASRCDLVVHLAPAAARTIQAGASMQVRVAHADGDAVIEGEVSFLAPVVDAASGLRQVIVSFANPDGKATPGTTGALALP